MKEIGNIRVIAVDHGYGNIKTANTVTPTGVTASKTEPIFSGNILEYEGIYYRIGEGCKEFVADKALDEDYKETITGESREIDRGSLAAYPLDFTAFESVSELEVQNG